MTEIRHTVSAEEFAYFKELFAPDLSPFLKGRLRSIGIAVEEPPRAAVTREEFDQAYIAWRSVEDIEAFLSRLNIHVTP